MTEAGKISAGKLPVPFRRRRAASTPVHADPIFGARPRAELEFLPAALEVVETPPPPLPRVAALVMVSLLVVILIWAGVGRVDVVSSAPGKLIPAGGGKVIQPLDAGRVSAIYARDGERVRKGQVLVQLEPTETMADRNQLQSELAAAKLDVSRLQAVALGHPFARPGGEDPAAIALAKQQATAQAAEREAKLATLDRQVEQHKAEIVSATDEIARLQDLLKLQQQRTEMYRSLSNRGFGSKLLLLDAQEKEEDIRRQIEEQQNHIPELQAEIAAIGRERAETAAESANTDLGQLSDAEVKVAALTDQLNKAQDKLKDQTLTSPVDGTVQELQIHTIGGVVEPGETLMRIAPAGAAVEVEAKLPNRDVGFVRAGMPAAVKVETFPFTKYGVIRGRVASVSNDAVSEKRPDGSEELNYLVRILLERDTMDIDGRTVRLEPGMAVTADVRTGRRRIIDYVLSPLAKAAREAGRER